MIKILCLLAVIMSACLPLFGQGDSAAYTLEFLPRINSAGHFPYSGAVLNRNLNFDLNIYYERKGYGFFIFKSIDLEDSRSYVNYLQPGIFRKFWVGKRIWLGPYVGYVFSQSTGFRDSDSDFWSSLIGELTVSKHITVENTALVLNLTGAESYPTLANRLLIRCRVAAFRLDFYWWQRVIFRTGFQATSVGIILTLPPAQINERLSLLSSFAYQGYLTEARPAFALPEGFVFTIAAPIKVR